MSYSVRKSVTVFSSASVLAIAMVVTGANISASLSASNTINACVNKKSGVIRQLTSGMCTSKETPLTWNKTGVQGPRGLQGVRGLQGERGIQGEQGLLGPRGIQGDSGVPGSDASSIGLYAADVEYGSSSISNCSDFNACTSILMRVGNLSNLSDSTATHLVLTSTKWLQATATVALRTVEDQNADFSNVSCNVKSGATGTNPRTWASFATSSVTVAEINASDRAFATLTITGAKRFTPGDYDFLVDCLQQQVTPDSQVISDRQVLNIKSIDVS